MTGASSVFSSVRAFADPYKPGWSHTLDTLWGLNSGGPVPGQPGNNPQTREFFEHYLDYAILASSSDSIGDLQFDITVLQPIHYIYIFVPPEFKWLAPTKEEAIWTDITNDYEFIYTSTRSAYDPIAPSWVRVRVGVDYGYDTAFTIVPGMYHIRLFDLRAPEVAGLYHFKIYTNLGSIGAANFPVIVVKNELNPAYVAVTVRANYNFPPVLVSGSVMADGTTPEGRAVKGAAYWGPWSSRLLDPSGTPGNEYLV